MKAIKPSGPLVSAATAIKATQKGAPETIGYGEQTQAAFRHGWNAAMDHVWRTLGLGALTDGVERLSVCALNIPLGFSGACLTLGLHTFSVAVVERHDSFGCLQFRRVSLGPCLLRLIAPVVAARDSLGMLGLGMLGAGSLLLAILTRRVCCALPRAGIAARLVPLSQQRKHSGRVRSSHELNVVSNRQPTTNATRADDRSLTHQLRRALHAAICDHLAC